ncbi:dUTP diphosphatase [Enterovirga rhinocerotis]|uniref:dUTP diphosphatase n=1 Tax=Enterovirga rhinocerotis TaxID=1339210 RepID=A0A4R7C096_9HYPH|nr:dUTP diphosphatase [Enterovirga rhinocerotis]TDR90475.1 dUTP pyrophosphatase [Enterovirga rhinocerotis]
MGERGLPVEVKLLDPRLPGWGFPRRGSALAAGLDLHACLDEAVALAPGAPPVLISSGLAMRIGQPGWCALVVPRSGLGHRGLVLGNTIGVIDADYEGPVTLSCWNRNAGPDAEAIRIEPGDRIAQLLLVPVACPDIRVVDTFEGASARGAGGFGSTGIGHAAGRPPLDGR